MTVKKLPEFPEGFTPEFLSEILDKNVVQVEKSELGVGTGMMADISRLALSLSDGTRLSLIAKYATANPTNRDVAISYNLYEREGRYYAELDDLADIVTPEIYYSHFDGNFMLILMEDLKDYDVGSQVIGATFEQTELAVDELAKLHSTFWDKVDHLDWVPGIADSYHAENMMNLARSGWDNMVELFGDFIPHEIRGYRDTFLEVIPKLQATQHSEPRTLCHGDFRMENLLYAASQDHHPVVVIDWQGPLLSRGMFDVALFLGQSTKKEVRQAHERQLLERYLNGLEQGGVTGLDADRTWEEYRSTNLYDWVYTAVVAGNLDASDEVAFAWMSEMVDRQSVVSLDLDVFDLLPD